ncbi:MAG: hypothetical protein JWL91_402, partial [Sphingomonas bacterium]|nr:hypothetical protein [Sphingomonas bacterium]
MQFVFPRAIGVGLAFAVASGVPGPES